MPWTAVLVGAAIAVVALSVHRERTALRRAREQRDTALRAALTGAAEQLSLSASAIPTGTPRPGYALSADVDGYTATLTAFEDYTVLSVALVAAGLPAALNLNRWPRGRAAEDIYLGVAVESGYDPFDAHFCVTGPPEILRQYATTLDRALLDVIAESHSTSTAFDVSLGGKELRLALWLDPAASHPITAERYVKIWRAAESIVRRGVARGVFRQPGM